MPPALFALFIFGHRVSFLSRLARTGILLFLGFSTVAGMTGLYHCTCLLVEMELLVEMAVL
jgi:hypothetical protein